MPNAAAQSAPLSLCWTPANALQLTWCSCHVLHLASINKSRSVSASFQFLGAIRYMHKLLYVHRTVHILQPCMWHVKAPLYVKACVEKCSTWYCNSIGRENSLLAESHQRVCQVQLCEAPHMTNAAHDCLLLVASHWPPCQVQSLGACKDSKTATLGSCTWSTRSLAAYTVTSHRTIRRRMFTC